MKPIQAHMEAAIAIALQAKQNGDYAIGAVVVKDNKIIAEGINRVKTDQDPTHHAEIVAIRQAAKLFGQRHLPECVLYTTHEPCPMCTGAIIFARMKGLVFGARIQDMKDFRLQSQNETWSWRTIDIPAKMIIEKSPYQLELIEDYMREECRKLFHI